MLRNILYPTVQYIYMYVAEIKLNSGNFLSLYLLFYIYIIYYNCILRYVLFYIIFMYYFIFIYYFFAFIYYLALGFSVFTVLTVSS